MAPNMPMPAYMIPIILRANGKLLPTLSGKRWSTCFSLSGLTRATTMKLKKKAPSPNPIRHVPLHNPISSMSYLCG